MGQNTPQSFFFTWEEKDEPFIQQLPPKIGWRSWTSQYFHLFPERSTFLLLQAETCRSWEQDTIALWKEALGTVLLQPVAGMSSYPEGHSSLLEELIYHLLMWIGYF
jgi:hypothetical protein